MELRQDVNKNEKLLDFLISHINYSVADIDSYEDLTPSEKEMISPEYFNELFINKD